MNQKAAELGMNQTHFMNPIGLHHPDHYTTAEEMVMLVRYALNDELFRNVFTAQDYKTTKELLLESTMFASIPRTTVTNGKVIGGKTGFTLEAGRYLVSLAIVNGTEYIEGAEYSTTIIFNICWMPSTSTINYK